MKQNFPLKFFLGDNRNAIQIQIRVSLIAWLLMQVVKKQVKKRKWSLSNLMTALHILLNSYINLYDFLNLPEGQWLRIIQNRSPKDDISPQLELFPQKRDPILRITKPMPIYRQLNNRTNQPPIFIGQQ